MASGDALVRRFSYDPLYWLRSANGRECDLPTASPPWDDKPRCVDINRTRGYTEQYQYDRAGNLLELKHQSSGMNFTRQLAPSPESNRLATMTVGETVHAYVYDANGNLLRENSSRHFEWDHSDRMKVFRTQSGGAEPSVYAQYLYDAHGQRVKKLVRKQGGRVEVTVYIDFLFEHQTRVQGATVQENNSLHVMDEQSRIALIRVGEPFPDDTTPAVKFHLSDHLGSSHLVIDDRGRTINREAYTPYGETSFGRFTRKRYRFGGKERDEESSLSYHGARYYAPWLGRWTSADPAGMVDGSNLYRFVRNNPISFADPSGLQPKNKTAPKEPAPMHGSSGFQMLDVQQGALGTCGVLAVLAGLADKRPELLGQLIRQTAVAYEVYLGSRGKPAQARYSIRSSHLRNSTGAASRYNSATAKHTWVAAIEHAMLKHYTIQKQGNLAQTGTNPSEVWALFGQKGGSRLRVDLNDYGPGYYVDKDEAWKFVSQSSDQNKLVFLSTSPALVQRLNNGTSRLGNISPNHAFYIKDVRQKDGGPREVLIYNPHGRTVQNPTGKPIWFNFDQIVDLTDAFYAFDIPEIK